MIIKKNPKATYKTNLFMLIWLHIDAKASREPKCRVIFGIGKQRTRAGTGMLLDLNRIKIRFSLFLFLKVGRFKESSQMFRHISIEK